MSTASRHGLNALICVLLLGHAIYWFAIGSAAGATGLRVGLAVAQAAVGAAGAVWFWLRSRGAV